jgi:hypothetical protein
MPTSRLWKLKSAWTRERRTRQRLSVRGRSRVLHGALVRAQEPPLRQRRNPMDPRHQLAWVLTTGPCGALVARLVLVTEVDEPGVGGGPAIGDNRAAWFDMVLHEGLQRFTRRVWHHLHPTPAELVPAAHLDSRDRTACNIPIYVIDLYTYQIFPTP